MTRQTTTVAATFAAFAAAVAVAVASPGTPAPGTQPRTAVIADRAAAAPSGGQIVRVSSAAEARVAAARLAAADYARIVAAGPHARAGLAEARAAGLLATR
ncbi:MAG TPA: hypothetical protein VFZ89_01170 [Solirubrobacteraceae bacterium]